MATQDVVEPYLNDTTSDPESMLFKNQNKNIHSYKTFQLGKIVPSNPLKHIQYVNVKLLFATKLQVQIIMSYVLQWNQEHPPFLRYVWLVWWCCESKTWWGGSSVGLELNWGLSSGEGLWVNRLCFVLASVYEVFRQCHMATTGDSRISLTMHEWVKEIILGMEEMTLYKTQKSLFYIPPTHMRFSGEVWQKLYKCFADGFLSDLNSEK